MLKLKQPITRERKMIIAVVLMTIYCLISSLFEYSPLRNVLVGFVMGIGITYVLVQIRLNNMEESNRKDVIFMTYGFFGAGIFFWVLILASLGDIPPYIDSIFSGIMIMAGMLVIGYGVVRNWVGWKL